MVELAVAALDALHPKIEHTISKTTKQCLRALTNNKPSAPQLNKKLVQIARCEHARVSLSSRHVSKKS
jgi:hypothetical protein